jgi:drug/metabolite transporter (DMT)-like permease
MTSHHRGVALCVLSACGFGAMAIFAKEAYAGGFEVADLLALRFLVAAILFWAIAAALGVSLPSRRVALIGLAMGAFGYAVQAGLYFGALTRIDASLTALLLYAYPALVVVAAIAIGREHASPARLGALALATAGTALVLVGGGVGGLDALGVAMGLGAACVYAVYILVADRVLAGVDPLALAPLIMTGGAVTTGAVAVLTGDGLSYHVDLGGWAAFAGVAGVSTVIAVTAFFAGLRLVGPATASIVSTVEPVVTVGLAVAIFAETLGAGQVAGGVLVLLAVVLLQRRAGTVAADAAPDLATAPAPARALAREPA